jgi:hypothetical protein
MSESDSPNVFKNSKTSIKNCLKIKRFEKNRSFKKPAIIKLSRIPRNLNLKKKKIKF